MTRRRARRGEARQLVAAVAAEPPGGCVLWPFAQTAFGYGVCADWTRPLFQRPTGAMARPVILAHRLAWELHHGKPFPEELVARHTCGNGHLGCFNPAHITPGTDAENRQDTIAMGRNNHGARNGQARLTEADVVEIRRRRAGGARRCSIAQEFGVSVAAVDAIVARRRWGHVA